MSHLRRLIAAGASGLLLAACADTDELGPETDPDPAQQEDAEQDEPADADADSVADEDAVADEVEPDEDEEADDQLLVEFDDPFIWEEQGIRVAVTGVGITDAHGPTSEDVVDLLDEGTNTVVSLEMTASNDYGDEITLYLNQGEVQIGREQVEADMFLSDSFAGEMRDGTDDSGRVIWQLTTDYEDVLSELQLDYVFSGPNEAETFEPVVDGNVEMVIDWEAAYSVEATDES